MCAGFGEGTVVGRTPVLCTLLCRVFVLVSFLADLVSCLVCLTRVVFGWVVVCAFRGSAPERA